MGRESRDVKATILVSLGRHNDPAEADHDGLADEMEAELRNAAAALAADPRYSVIDPVVL